MSEEETVIKRQEVNSRLLVELGLPKYEYVFGAIESIL